MSKDQTLTQFYPANEITGQESTTFNTICNLCSVGCTLEVYLQNGKIREVRGASGLINEHAEYCELPARSYKAISNYSRVTSPLLRKGNELVPVSWEEAFDILNNKVKEGDPENKAFFAGARLTNEEQFLIMKLSRTCANCNDIGSLHYLGRGTGYTRLSRANIPFAELVESKKIYLLGAEVFRDNPVAGTFVSSVQCNLSIPVIAVTKNPASELVNKSNNSLIINSYFHFVKAVNHYIVANGLEDHDYIKNLVQNFEDYKAKLLACDFAQLCTDAGVSGEIIQDFAVEFRNEMHAVIVFSENELSGHACGEIFNLAMLTGKHGRTGAGLMLLKENNNTHGLHDMGVMWNLGPGATPWDDPFQRSTVEFTWRSKELPTKRGYTLHKLRETGYDSLFIFGEDPVGCAINADEIKSLLAKSSFIMVQDYFLTETARMADLVLPASFPFETGGTFTNSQRVIQKVSKKAESPLSCDSWKQLEELLARNGFPRYETIDDVTFEIASLLPKFCTSSKLLFRINEEDNYNPVFHSGCDVLLHIAKTSV